MKRLTLDLQADFHRRLEARAVFEMFGMRQYCLAAIEKQLLENEAKHGDGSTMENFRK